MRNGDFYWHGVPLTFTEYLISLGLSVAGLCVLFIGFAQEDKQIQEEKKKLELKLATDANVSDFNLNHLEFNQNNSDYFLTFTGTAVKMSGEPINFISTKYCICEKNYYELITELDGSKEFKEKEGIFTKILDIVNESDLVYNSEIKELSKSIIDEKNDEVVALRSVTNPKIVKDKNVVVYEVEMFKFNHKETENPKIEFIKKQVVVPLTKKIEDNVNCAFLVDKKDCQVRTLSKSFELMKDRKFLTMSNSR